MKVMTYKKKIVSGMTRKITQTNQNTEIKHCLNPSRKKRYIYILCQNNRKRQEKDTSLRENKKQNKTKGGSKVIFCTKTTGKDRKRQEDRKRRKDKKTQ